MLFWSPRQLHCISLFLNFHGQTSEEKCNISLTPYVFWWYQSSSDRLWKASSLNLIGNAPYWRWKTKIAELESCRGLLWPYPACNCESSSAEIQELCSRISMIVKDDAVCTTLTNMHWSQPPVDWTNLHLQDEVQSDGMKGNFQGAVRRWVSASG